MSVTFEEHWFAQGRFQNAYKGTWTQPRKKKGQECVVKEKKDVYTWNSTDWNTSLEIREEAQKLADSFIASLKPPCPVSFAAVYVHQVVQKDSSSGPNLHEQVLVEDFIPGSYKKWCNNYGFISDEAKTTDIMMPAFMHCMELGSHGR